MLIHIMTSRKFYDFMLDKCGIIDSECGQSGGIG